MRRCRTTAPLFSAGDTPVGRFLPILCVRPGRLEAPPEISPGPDAGWLRGEVRATPEVPGAVLTSRGRGDLICADTFGAGWRLAESHDGRYGSDLSLASVGSFWGVGSLPAGARFWVAVDDRRANPWDSPGKPPETLERAPRRAWRRART